MKAITLITIIFAALFFASQQRKSQPENNYVWAGTSQSYCEIRDGYIQEISGSSARAHAYDSTASEIPGETVFFYNRVLVAGSSAPDRMIWVADSVGTRVYMGFK